MATPAAEVARSVEAAKAPEAVKVETEVTRPVEAVPVVVRPVGVSTDAPSVECSENVAPFNKVTAVAQRLG